MEASEDDEQEDDGDLFIVGPSIWTPFCPKRTKMEEKLKWGAWKEIKNGFLNPSFSLFPFSHGVLWCHIYMSSCGSILVT